MGMSRIYVVGLTGPTGAGKSLVSALLKEHGIQSVDADVIGHAVTEKNSRGLYELSVAFGDDIIKPDGTLDRPLLAKKAFSDPEKLRLLNDITHPLITMEIRRRIRELENEGVSIVSLDAALLFESGADILCNDTIAVLADRAVRKKRIIARDSLSEEDADRRINAQKSDEYYLSKANHTVYNNGDIEKLTADLVPIVRKMECEAAIRSGIPDIHTHF